MQNTVDIFYYHRTIIVKWFILLARKIVIADILSRYLYTKALIVSQDLDYISYILAIEASEIVNYYETIFNYIYQYI